MHGSSSGHEAALDPPAQVAARQATASDASLVRRAKRGSADAVEELVRRHWAGAHRAAFLIVRDAAAAEDVTQEAMLAAIRAIDDFDRRRPFRPWLHRIVVNRSLDWVRARQRRPECELSDHPGVEHDASGISDDLMAALAALDPDRRALVVLRYLLGYRSPEIGRMVGLPPATVRTRLARALAVLRDQLDAKEQA